jgi:hypothetical protein
MLIKSFEEGLVAQYISGVGSVYTAAQALKEIL